MMSLFSEYFILPILGLTSWRTTETHEPDALETLTEMITSRFDEVGVRLDRIELALQPKVDYE